MMQRWWCVSMEASPHISISIWNKAKLLCNIFTWKWVFKKRISKLLGTPFGKNMETKDVNEFLIEQLKKNSNIDC
jgi:hypothetical protein